EGLNPELIFPRRQVVKGFAPAQGFGPLVIVIFEHVSKANALLRAQADGAVSDLQLSFTGRGDDGFAQGRNASVEQYLLDGDFGQALRAGFRRANSHRPAIAWKPDFAGRGHATGRRNAAVNLSGFYAV